MNLDDSARRDVINRLKRVRGQLDGVIGMMEEGRSCREVVTQLAAANKALDKAGYKLIAASMQECLLNEGSEGLTPQEIEKLFITLA